nr:immunoglobulin heavy chain junction region [Macaca mulatta]MOV45759.1 immunoglobulin heavy chain junction region [Macaca mulatta]
CSAQVLYYYGSTYTTSPFDFW